MSGPRSKTVVVGGREFVVRPLLGITQKEIESSPPTSDTDGVVALCAKILHRTAPDITSEWLLMNGDQTEYADILAALREVTTGKKDAPPGEVAAP